MGSLMSRRLRVVIIHDEGAGSEGLRTLIRGLPQFLLMAEVKVGPKALELIGNRNPDVAVIELTTPETAGTDVVRSIVTDHPRVRTLVLAASNDPTYTRDMIATGVHGYLLKDASIEEVGRALMSITRGESYYSPEVTRVVEEDLMKPESGDVRRKAS